MTSPTRRASAVHTALQAVTDAARYLPADSVLVDGVGVYVIAPNPISVENWRAKYPAGHIVAGGAQVPLHVCVAGDMEGNQS